MGSSGLFFLITTLGGFLGALLFAVAVKVLADVAQAKISKRSASFRLDTGVLCLLALSLALLPSATRARYRDEWFMFLVDQPTPRRRILQSAFLIKSAISIDCQLAIGFAAKDAGGRVKRTADILIACTALLLLSPLMLAIAVLVKIDSSGPVFFYQTRLGRNGQNFAILKFRTLVPLNEGIPVASTRDDFRVTRVGKWLRATSTDVLPALVNILLGDMSTVGPSPLAPALAEYLLDKDELALRNSVRPGLTGLAQARGYQEAGDFNLARKRIEADLEYIRGRSFLLDVRIILRTVRAVLFPPKDFQ